MIYFTADTHFNHLLIANHRGFFTTMEHDNIIISNWNQKIKSHDEVYHLGDFCFGDHDIVRSIRAKLNGKIHLILGNHDYSNRIKNIKGLFTSIYDIKEIKINGHKTILSHYAMRVWPSSHYNSWHLFGHSHGKLLEYGKSFDVGLDTNNLNVYTSEEIMNKMNICNDNFNYIK